MIRRDWVEVARATIPDPAERGRFYDAIFSECFDLDGTPELSPMAAGMMAMVRMLLAADKEAYVARCERNKRNAQSLRLGASGSDSQRVGASGCNTNTNTNTKTNTNTNTIPLPSGEAESREKFDIIGIFFSRGSKVPLEEAKAFWNYYESLGWRNNKGALIVSKKAAARQWRLQTDIAPDEAWRDMWYASMKSAPTTDPRVWTWPRAIDLIEGELRLFLAGSGDFMPMLEERCRAQLQHLMQTYGATSLVYRVPQ